ncbi:protein-L-isoaspartate O-methyltransferase family protein [Kiloniella laminariae]|uniref:protein-L-isoaspartate O-methyltransferase family protein n=1 Tax=Kiloniella laminariae TaxID=454162 RepID=UPI000375AEBE|nr:protein-L-isoaspartate O-methyltransferase [Kiloniella laminariae]
MMVNFQQARVNMVNSQLRTNKVTHAGVLDAFETVAREEFVPEASKSVAYVDEDLAVGHGRYLMEPMVLARMLQIIEPQAHETALVVGAATGYAATVLSKLVNAVIALESEESLVAGMNETFSQQGAENAVAVAGALNEGYAKQAAYDLIVLGGAVAEISAPLFDQLAEKGRLIAVVQDNKARNKQDLGHVTVFEKHVGQVSSRIVFDANTPLLPGFEPKAVFSF